MTELSVVMVVSMLLAAALVAMLAQRLHLPYSAGLLLAGLALAAIPRAAALPLSRDLIFEVLLPPLVFQAALDLDWRRFRDNLPVTALLAFPGVLIAVAVVTFGMHQWLGWSWLGAAFFGALIAAVDPVAVVAAFKKLPVEPRVGMLVEAESLLNDGAAATAFGLLVVLVGQPDSSALSMTLVALGIVAGGLAAGAVAGTALLLVVGRTADPLVEITLTTVAAYASFLLADHFGSSGVLATLVAGLIVGNLGLKGPISEPARGHVTAFWQYWAFVATAVVFLLIGSHEAQQPFSLFTWDALAAIAIVMLSRVLSVYPLCALLALSRHRVAPAAQHLLVWGGLRGALALALALAVPEQVPEQREIIVLAFAVVGFSVLVQGVTAPAAIRRLGLTTDGDAPDRDGA